MSCPKRPAALLLLTCALVLSGPALPSCKAQQAVSQDPRVSAYGRAQRLMAQGLWAKAEPILRRHLARSGSPRVKFQLGLCLLNLWKPAEAEPLIKGAVEARPQRESWWRALAHALQLQEKHRAATDALERAVALRPLPSSLFKLALNAGAAGRPERSRATLERCVLQDPGHSAALLALGRMLAEEGKDREARALFERSVRADPGNLEAVYRLGLVSSKLGEHEKAIAAFEQVLRRLPNHAGAAYGLARALARLPDRREEARAKLEEFKRISKVEDELDLRRAVVSEHPRVIEARIKLIKLLMKSGYIEEALTEAQTARRLAPASGEVRDVLTKIRSLLGRPAGDEILDKRPRSRERP